MKEKLREYLEKLADDWDNYVLNKSHSPIGLGEATDQILTLLKEEIRGRNLPEAEIEEIMVDAGMSKRSDILLGAVFVAEAQRQKILNLF